MRQGGKKELCLLVSVRTNQSFFFRKIIDAETSQPTQYIYILISNHQAQKTERKGRQQVLGFTSLESNQEELLKKLLGLR